MKLNVLSLSVLLLITGVAAACGGGPSAADPTSTPTVSDPTATTAAQASLDPTSTPAPEDSGDTDSERRSFVADIWVDNWFAAYVDGEQVAEDSVPITTERSFNKETFTFEASYPFVFSVVTKDFKENDSGLEYIGTNRQQMGDGGFIGQIMDAETGEVVAVTNSGWRGLVIHAAPLNKGCEKDADPTSSCESEITAEPANWQDASFDDSNWIAATEHSEASVSPKDGYDEVNWDRSAELIWSSDLETDNTILWRLTVSG